MSRLAKIPIKIPKDISIKLNSTNIVVKGVLGELKHKINKYVNVKFEDHFLFFSFKNTVKSYGWMQAGTCYAIVKTMILGVSQGFIKKLQLTGIGYRATMETNNILKLFLGFSHPIIYHVPNHIIISIINQNEIIIKGISKQLVGQVAANIRSYRIPEPYKGKGIRYINERIRIKEAKKK